MKTGLTILAKSPEPGLVKTRLAVTIGEAAACELHEALALDVIQAVSDWFGPLSGSPAPLVLSLTGAEDVATRLSRPARHLGARLERQVPGDLGARILAVIGARLDEGFGASLVLGSDAPTVGRGLLDEAVAALREADVVFTPASDGGFVLFGARRLADGALDGVSWGGGDALSTARAAVARAGLSHAVVGSEEDVDDIEALRRLSRRLEGRPELAPRTARWLSGRQNLLRLGPPTPK